MEIRVARAAPVTSMPFGRRTNMKIGSRMIFRMPAIATPNPASLEYPALRMIVGILMESTAGTAPSTTVKRRYCRP